jgi:hypothetical protein
VKTELVTSVQLAVSLQRVLALAETKMTVACPSLLLLVDVFRSYVSGFALVAYSVAPSWSNSNLVAKPRDFESHAVATATLQLAGEKENGRTAITTPYKSAKMLRAENGYTR